MRRSPSELPPLNARKTTDILSNFYREEFVKHQQCLKQQREYYSERAITDVEAALTRIIANLDQICAQGNAGELVSRWLQKLDTVTGLSAWSDPSKFH